MKLELNGVVKTAPEGFSWTTFFFGGFVPLFRGDMKWSVISLIAVVLGCVATMGIGSLIYQIFMSFKYNNFYINDLKEKGYKELKPIYETE